MKSQNLSKGWRGWQHGFVSGHDFQSCRRRLKMNRALAPEAIYPLPDASRSGTGMTTNRSSLSFTVSQHRKPQDGHTDGLWDEDPRWYSRMIASIGCLHAGHAKATLFPKESQRTACPSRSKQTNFVTLAVATCDIRQTNHRNCTCSDPMILAALRGQEATSLCQWTIHCLPLQQPPSQTQPRSVARRLTRDFSRRARPGDKRNPEH